MGQDERIKFLKQISTICKEIVNETKGEVSLYDKLTKEVDQAVKEYKTTGKISKATMKGWVSNQKRLFSAYKDLIDAMTA